MYRHITPGQHALAVRLNNTLKVTLHILALYNIRRQEQKAYGILALLRQLNILLSAFLHKKIMRNLQQYTCTITGVHICTLATAVIHIMQHNQCLSQDFIRFFTLDISNNTNTAGIMLKPGIIKSLLLR